jgi:hypothetical protein
MKCSLFTVSEFYGRYFIKCVPGYPRLEDIGATGQVEEALVVLQDRIGTGKQDNNARFVGHERSSIDDR